MANDYVVNIVLKAKAEAAAAFAGMSAHMVALTAETALVNEALKHLNNTANEHSGILSHMALDQMSVVAATERMAASLEGKLTPAMNNVNKASGNNGGAASGLMAFVQGAIPGQQTAGNITIAIAAAAAAFAPFTAELAASLVLMGAWVVGAAAMATTLAIAVAPLALLTAGIIALGISATGGQKALDNLAPAQKAAAAAAETHENALQALARAQLAYDNNPSAANLLRLQQAHEHVADAADKNTAAQQKLTAAQINANGALATLDKHFESLVKTLGQQAVPIMAVWITYLDSLLPRLLSIGQSIMTWYGDRLPVFLRTVSTAVDAALPAIERLAEAWGRLVDQVIARIPAWGPIVGGAFNFVIDAAIGLMNNLLALSDWFVARLPTLGANATATFDHIGMVVQAVGGALGVFVDWIIAHWPGVTAVFDATWGAIQAGVGVVVPLFKALGDWFNFLAPLTQFLADHMTALKDVFFVLAIVVATVVVVAIVLIGSALLLFATIVVGVIWAIGELVRWIGQNLPAAIAYVGGFFSELGDGAHQIAAAIGSFFSELGDGAHQIAMALGAAAAAVGSFFSGLGSGVQAGLAIIGGFFSAFGSAVKTVTDAIGRFFTAVWGVITATGNVIGVVLQGIQTVVFTALAIILGFFILQFTAIWNFISPLLERIRDLVGAVFSAIGTTISTVLNFVWHGVIEPVWSAILVFLSAVWNVIVQVATVTWTFWYGVISHWITVARDFIVAVWNAILGFLTTVWNTIVQVATATWTIWYSTVSHWVQVVWDFIVRVWNTIVGFLQTTWNTINQHSDSGWNSIWGTITGWAGRIRDTVQGVWNGMVGSGRQFVNDLWATVKGGLNETIKVLDAFIDPVNSALHPILGHDAVAHIPTFATGGVLPGYAPGQDTVLAMLSPGEGILTPQAVRGMGGAAAIDNINAQYQHFASGGVVNPYPQGQCTWGVWEMFPGMPVDGNAWQWINLPLQHAAGPAAGEIVVYDSGLPGSGGYGHVARVDGGLINGMFPVTETNYTHPLGWDTRMSSMAHVAGFLVPGVPGQPGGATGGLSFGADILGSIVDGALGVARGLLSGVPDWIRGVPDALLTQLADGIKRQFGAAFTPTGGAQGSIGPATAGGNLALWILDAIAATGVPTSWSSPLTTLIMRESGGNPNAVNRTDSNAAAGHPSQGLAQVIPGTFAAYHQAGTSSNILDPVANIAAAINYIKSRYGTIFNVQQANPALPPRGYDNGGALPTGLSYVYNGTGRTETVTPATTMDRVEQLLSSIDQHLASLAGRPRLGAQLAMVRNGG